MYNAQTLPGQDWQPRWGQPAGLHEVHQCGLPAVPLFWRKDDRITCHPPCVRESWQAPLQQTPMGASEGASGGPPIPFHDGNLLSPPASKRPQSSTSTWLTRVYGLSLVAVSHLKASFCSSCTGCAQHTGISETSHHDPGWSCMNSKFIPMQRFPSEGRDKMSLILLYIKKTFIIFLTCWFCLLAKYTIRLKYWHLEKGGKS